MSLDALLSILFVVVFIVLPLVSRGMRARSRGSGGSPRAPAPPARGAGPGSPPPWLVEAQRRVREAQAALEQADRPVASDRPAPELVPEDAFGPLAGGPRPAGGLAPSDPSPPLAPEARGGGLVRSDPSPPLAPEARRGGLVPGDPFERKLVGPADAARAASTLGREGPARVARTPETLVDVVEIDVLGMGERMRRRGRRRMQSSGARLGAVGRVRFDRDSIVSGLIWHEILEEPAWIRRRGRRPSRLRSR